MPCALIAGIGYLGQGVANLLVGDWWEVEGWTLSPESAGQLSHRECAIHAIDISDGDQVRARQKDFDAVIHCASTRGGDADSYRRVYMEGARNLLANFANARFVFISSTSVYAQNTGEWVSEESPAEPTQETGRILRQSEDLVLGAGGIAVRLGGLYGPGRSALLQKFLSGEAKIDPESDRFMNQIHRDDAAVAIQLLLRRGQSACQIYNLVDNQPTLLGDCYRWLATRLDRPVPPAGRSTSKRKRGNSNKRVSNAKLRNLGWTPRYPIFADGMERSVLPTIVGDNA